ncbi:hypothetical protein ASD01_29575 [Ensifer sp. Root423]|nr:hypothetical protein ASD01_29575 [Ensifer sp. Root423]
MYVVGMPRVAFQLACVAATALVYFAFHEAFRALKAWFGPGFPVGFICGAVLVVVLWAISGRFDG